MLAVTSSRFEATDHWKSGSQAPPVGLKPWPSLRRIRKRRHCSSGGQRKAAWIASPSVNSLTTRVIIERPLSLVAMASLSPGIITT